MLFTHIKKIDLMNFFQYYCECKVGFCSYCTSNDINEIERRAHLFFVWSKSLFKLINTNKMCLIKCIRSYFWCLCSLFSHILNTSVQFKTRVNWFYFGLIELLNRMPLKTHHLIEWAHWIGFQSCVIFFEFTHSIDIHT